MVKKNFIFLKFWLFCGAFFFLTAPFFAKGEESNPKHREYLDAAAIFKESGEYLKAIEVLESVPPEGRDDEVSFYLGRLYYLTGETDKALNCLNTIENKSWLKYLYMGLFAEEKGNYGRAVNFYKKSNELKKNSIALFRLGKIHRSKNNYPEAVAYFNNLIKLDPSIRLAYYYAGECLSEISDYAGAYNFLAKSFNFYPRAGRIKKKLLFVKDRLGEDFFKKREAETVLKRKKVKLPFYYPDRKGKILNVGLATGLDKFSFSCAGPFVVKSNGNIFRGEAKKIYNISLREDNFMIKDEDGQSSYGPFSFPAGIKGLEREDMKPTFYVLDMVYGEKNFWHKKIDRIYRGDFRLVFDEGKFTLINVISLEEYLYGVLPSEIYADSHPQALKAQAVTARTIAVRNINRHRKEGFNLCADVHCQVYQGYSAEASSTNKAVDATRGEVIIFKGRPIEAFYHSNCGGCLCSDAFGELPFLANKIDYTSGCIAESAYGEDIWFSKDIEAFCAGEDGSKFRWQRFYDREDFLLAFGFGIEELEEIVPLKKRDCFHYNEVKIIKKNSQEFRLRGDLRIRNYLDRLRSSAFKIDIKTNLSGEKEGIFFWGAGFGHGSGLCQEGAVGMANSGYNYKEIISHYFPDTDINDINKLKLLS
ncbi:MAG: SpoIID/LytB domain-containing protein [Candidatus Omnitrophica bacterium]|nr:SpoIID/LytB domain-containing protein [Candidatus Omnitrophota bacterium]MBD3268956.1 SpoIID/LytB domain-containing protein [Candidatus Omnitrophota bacterium]